MGKGTRLFSLVAVLAIAACGSDREGLGETGGSSGRPGDDGPNGSSDGTSGGPSETEVAKDLAGVWTVTGKDARGAYHGQAEVRTEGGTLRFIRAIAYDTVKVEDGRELHWVFVGTAKGDTKKEVAISVTLENRDFVVARGDVKRTASDAPTVVTGKVRLENGKGLASYSAGGDETWEKRTPSGEDPLFVFERTLAAGHDPPSALEKTGFWSTYASFRDLPIVKPYASRPEFQAAIHGHIVDKTDLAFYRKNPNALRVVNKSIDAISLLETLSRANAYRSTLLAKAQGFDKEIESEFIHPTTGMLLEGAPPGQPKDVHFSAALWTGVYLASQVFRYDVTGDAVAKANVVKTLDGILKLQEVTGNWKAFARAIRPATGSPTAGWHPGAGALSNLEWLEGGNNDMMKGLYVAYVLGHRMLCKSPGHESLCARIRTNAKHLSDDINVDRGSDELDSAWLTTVVASDPIAKIQYQGKAEAAWVASKPVIVQNTKLYHQGTADWSGLNLGFVGDVFHMALADGYDVGGNGKTTFKTVIEESWKGLRLQRLPLWNLLAGAFAPGGANDAAIDDALWRLREMPFPKSVMEVDHRVSPDFCMSPYPSLPWKNDWTTTDRTQSLRSYPLFEDAMDLYRFRLEMKYAGNTTARPPAPEYLVAYWFGRKYGLIPASE